MTVLFNLFRFRAPYHRLLYSHSTYCEVMADVTIIIILPQKFIVRSRYLLYFINSVLSTMPQIGYMIFKYGLINKLGSAKCLFSLYQHTRSLKRGREKRLFTSRVIYDGWMERMLLLAEIFVQLLEIIARTCSHKCCACFANDSAVLNKPKTGCYFQISTTCIEQRLMARFFTFGMKNPYLI